MTDVLIGAPAAPDPRVLPAPGELLLAVGGFALLGLCAGIGAGDAGSAARAVTSGPLVGAGALVLTGPALVVAHQFLRLEARPELLVGALARGFVRAGALAAGLAPTALFFAVTSPLGLVTLAASLAAIGLLGLRSTAQALHAVEMARGDRDLLRDARMRALVFFWSGLCALIALRIGWDVAFFVVGDGGAR